MKRWLLSLAVFAVPLAAFAQTPPAGMPAPGASQAATYTAPKNDKIPPADPYVADALKSSPRHGEWVDIKMPSGPPLKAWVVFPNASGKMGVVLVIHEIFGMTDWVRGVADQIAEDGFIAIAPDFLSGMGPNGGGTESLGNQVGQAIRGLTPPDRAAKLAAAMAYGKTLSASNGKTASIGFCWGGDTSFYFATSEPTLNAAVVFYGQVPQLPSQAQGVVTVDEAQLGKLKAPVNGFYGGNDARVDQTIEPTKVAAAKLGKNYQSHVYEGAAHGFMHQRSEADYKAAEQAWPLTVSFFKEHLK
jgi:carboxymethylenebutenolidase